ncbi:N-acetyl-D-Glu racemase DgcA [Kordiimonas pumila]|uniref:Dipeptide epimerase n=1 Tax=Kordiimonas pumila TaxID=2161677 RepID=A0ABV7D5F9_9PROT|nr:N-acetyl-D-Glu racemase DgcA [Kordiimonas pumila]
MPKLTIRLETWPIAGTFTISRSSATESYVLVVELQEGNLVGRGECEPDDTDPAIGHIVAEQIYAVRQQIEQGISQKELLDLLPRGPARNAVDCALWDLACKKQGKPIEAVTGIPPLKPLTTAYTISIDTLDVMAEKAALNKNRALLKIKLNADECLAKINAIHAAAPDAKLIVDANEAWSLTQLQALAPEMAQLGVAMIEQPLPAGNDDGLATYAGPVPLCADESCLDRTSLAFVKERYQFINIKLDKTGGLTEALLLAEEAEKMGLRIMVGCMVGTSLAMAPALIVAQKAEFVDLDGPLLLAKDRENGMRYENSLVYPATPALWG